MSKEKEINACLRLMPPEKRPETSFRTRIQSVAYSAKGFYEATDQDGNTEVVRCSDAEAWIK